MWFANPGTTNSIGRITTGPGVVTGPASDVGSSAATLTGSARPNSQLTIFRFEYGTDTSYGSETAIQSAQDASEHQVSAALSGLSPDTTYHYRLVATNPTDTAAGADATFTTPPDGAGPPDATPPTLDLSGKKTQHLGAFVAVRASCPTEACEAKASGTVIVPSGQSKHGERKLRRVKLRPASAQLAAGGKAKLKLRISRKARKAAVKALDRGGRVRAKVAVVATDAAGNSATARRTVRLLP